jgi:hypothetical protein
MRASKQELCLDLDSRLGSSGDVTRGESNISVSKNSCSYTLVDLNRLRQSAAAARNARKAGGIPSSAGQRALARTLLDVTAMSFVAVVDRVRLDFVEMPEMEVTLPQAVRLWSLGMDDCRYVIDSLVDAGFLAWTPRRTIIRKGRGFISRHDTNSANISVLVPRTHNKSVWNG